MTRLHHRSFPSVGRAMVFAALTPILPGHAEELRTLLHGLPGGKRPVIGADRDRGESWLNLPHHHYARWTVITGFHYNGPPQQPDVLRSAYLYYSVCFDTMDLDAYLKSLVEHLGSRADDIWRHCVGYRGVDDLPRYLLHNAIPIAVMFAEYPEATVARVKTALEQRNALMEFVVDHQHDSPNALRKAWKAFAATAKAPTLRLRP